MTRRETTYGGSASIVIIAILFLALMAALGVVFYQNFIQKPESTKQASNTSKTDNQSKTKTARIAYHSVIYALDYPENWKITTDKVGSDDSDSLLESSSGNVSLRFAISSNGVGGTCDKKSELKVSYYNAQPAINTRLNGQSLALVETMYDHVGGGYDYLIGMTEDSGATHAAIGDAYCTILYTGIASSLKLSDTEPGVVEQPLIIANINFPKLKNDKGPAAPDMQTIKTLMSSDDYKAAVKILESARKE
jgi:hypothetical protein